MNPDLLMNLKGITPEEYAFLQHTMAGMSPQQARQFVMFYSGKRRSPQDILIFTLLGFVGAAGVQRFVTGQIVMGVLYLFTCGLCFIGTIVDLINHQSLASEYNQKQAFECEWLVKMMNPPAAAPEA